MECMHDSPPPPSPPPHWQALIAGLRAEVAGLKARIGGSAPSGGGTLRLGRSLAGGMTGAGGGAAARGEVLSALGRAGAGIVGGGADIDALLLPGGGNALVGASGRTIEQLRAALLANFQERMQASRGLIFRLPIVERTFHAPPPLLL